MASRSTPDHRRAEAAVKPSPQAYDPPALVHKPKSPAYSLAPKIAAIPPDGIKSNLPGAGAFTPVPASVMARSPSFSMTKRSPDPTEQGRLSTPSPMAYSTDVSPLRAASPKYSLKGRTKDLSMPRPGAASPGPAYSPVLDAKGSKLLGNAGAIMSTSNRSPLSPSNIESAHTPAACDYGTPPLVLKASSPSFSVTTIGHVPEYGDGSGSPGPAAYTIPPCETTMTSTPAFTMKPRRQDPARAPTPAPCDTVPPAPNTVKPKAPEFSMAARTKETTEPRPTDGPGPLAYDVVPLAVTKPRSAAYSMVPRPAVSYESLSPGPVYSLGMTRNGSKSMSSLSAIMGTEKRPDLVPAAQLAIPGPQYVVELSVTGDRLVEPSRAVSFGTGKRPDIFQRSVSAGPTWDGAIPAMASRYATKPTFSFGTAKRNTILSNGGGYV